MKVYIRSIDAARNLSRKSFSLSIGGQTVLCEAVIEHVKDYVRKAD
jgi:hypothetical protein